MYENTVQLLRQTQKYKQEKLKWMRKCALRVQANSSSSICSVSAPEQMSCLLNASLYVITVKYRVRQLDTRGWKPNVCPAVHCYGGVTQPRCFSFKLCWSWCSFGRKKNKTEGLLIVTTYMRPLTQRHNGLFISMILTLLLSHFQGEQSTIRGLVNQINPISHCKTIWVV